MLDFEYFIFCREIRESPHGQDLLGIFDMVTFSSFPGRHEPFHAHLFMRAKKAINHQDFHGRIVVEIENEKVFEAQFGMTNMITEKDNAVPVPFDFKDVVFPRAGMYHFKVYLGDKLIVTRKLRARAVEEFVEP